jgi:hypothetical protein
MINEKDMRDGLINVFHLLETLARDGGVSLREGDELLSIVEPMKVVLKVWSTTLDAVIELSKKE